MTTYVLVHGSFEGGWAWREFGKLISAEGHDVYTPTLTGLGERVHLGNEETNLTTHIQDIINVIEYEDLAQIVLSGHSYAGMVIAAVADCVPDRIAHLVFVDALLPDDGQSYVDLRSRDAVQIRNHRVLPPPSRPDMDLAEVRRRARWVGHPEASYQEKVRLQMPLEMRAFSRTYIRATNPPIPYSEKIAQRVRIDNAWRYHEVACGHSIQLRMPHELAKILLELG
jgi:pimeloyl-ACP methyl ester carboxylesterase